MSAPLFNNILLAPLLRSSGSLKTLQRAANVSFDNLGKCRAAQGVVSQLVELALSMPLVQTLSRASTGRTPLRWAFGTSRRDPLIHLGVRGKTMKLNLRLLSFLIVANGLLSHTTVAADPTTIQLGQLPNSLPTQMSLQLISSDQTTRTQVWATVADGNICAFPPDFNRHPSTLAIVTFSENPRLLLDDIQTKRILEMAIASQMAKCTPDQYSQGSAVAIDKRISTITSDFVKQAENFIQTNQDFEGVLARRREGPNANDYFNKVAAQHNSALRAAQEKQQREMAQRALDAKTQGFADRYGASGGWVNWQRLRINPFSYEGKILLFNAEFERMLTPTSGIFNGAVFSNIPQNTFTQPGTVLLAGKVLGTVNIKNQFGGEVPVPNVRYLGHINCRNSDCDGYFRGNLRHN